MTFPKWLMARSVKDLQTMMGQSEPHLPPSTNKQDMIKTLLPLADLDKTPSLDECEIAELHHMQLVHACWANERSGLETREKLIEALEDLLEEATIKVSIDGEILQQAKPKLDFSGEVQRVPFTEAEMLVERLKANDLNFKDATLDLLKERWELWDNDKHRHDWAKIETSALRKFADLYSLGLDDKTSRTKLKNRLTEVWNTRHPKTNRHTADKTAKAKYEEELAKLKATYELASPPKKVMDTTVPEWAKELMNYGNSPAKKKAAKSPATSATPPPSGLQQPADDFNAAPAWLQPLMTKITELDSRFNKPMAEADVPPPFTPPIKEDVEHRTPAKNDDPIAELVRRLLHPPKKNKRARADADDDSDDDDDDAQNGAKDVRALRKIMLRTRPHMVNINYQDEPEAFGLQVQRALQYIDEDGDDPGEVAMHTYLEKRKEDCLMLFNSGAPEEHAEGEREYVSIVIRCMQRASLYEDKQGIEGAKEKRASQITNFNPALEKMQKQLRRYASFMPTDAGKEFYRRQMALACRTSFGVSMAMTALKALTKHDDVRAQLVSRYAQAGPPPPPPPPTAHPFQLQQPPPPYLPPTHNRQQQVPPGGLPARPLQVGEDPHARKCGVHQPLSIAVVGTNTLHADTKAAKECRTDGCKELHLKWECPIEFYRITNKVMPGFDAQGKKDPQCWVGTEITGECRRRWMQARAAGHFTVNPYTRNGSPYPFM